jgi:LacI family transcriptional regulator
MTGRKEVTIYDLAKELNISIATVSRALKDDPVVNKKTRKKIFELAERRGYRSNHFARNLRTLKTNTIGIMMHELNSHFMTSVLAGVEKVTTEAGFDLIIAHSSESFVKEAANAKNLFHKRVDGLIASLSSDTQNLDHFRPFIDKGIPLIFFDRVEPNHNNTVVVIDNHKCGYEATAHLISQGCKRIAHITSSLQRNVYSERYRGYRDALSKHGMGFSEDMLIINGLSEEEAIDSAKKLLRLRPLPDAAFITNDFVAAVCMRVWKENKIAIPDKLAVVGFNNDTIATLIEPTLTTINYPGKQMGEVVAHNLINHLSGKGDLQKIKTIVVNSELIVRQSSLKAAARK